MKRSWSLRKSLITGSVGLILLVSVSIMSISFYRAKQAAGSLAQEVVEEAGNQVREEVYRYFMEVARNLEILAQWAQNRGLNPEDIEETGALLWPSIKVSTRVSSAMLANQRGAELLFLQDSEDPHKRLTRLVNPVVKPGMAYFKEFDRSGLIREEWSPFVYNTRNWGYFKEAVKELGQVRWTPPSIFFVTRDPGLTASLAWENNQGDTLVMALDLLLLDLSRLTMSFRLGERGQVFILTNDEEPKVVPKFGRT